MFELFKIVLTAGLTLLGGVLLLVFSQIFTRLIIDPYIEFKRLLGEISHALVLYSDRFFNAPTFMTSIDTKFEEGKRQCRNLASRLRSFSNAGISTVSPKRHRSSRLSHRLVEYHSNHPARDCGKAL